MGSAEVNKTEQTMTGLLGTVVQVVHCIKVPVKKGASAEIQASLASKSATCAWREWLYQ